jgi:hypothetical protein
LPARAEPWISALLLTGLLLNLALALQFAQLLQWLAVFPLSLPLITPFVLSVMFWRELARRLRAAAQRAQSPLSLGPRSFACPS